VALGFDPAQPCSPSGVGYTLARHWPHPLALRAIA
jgi:hypothetical protein